MSPGHKLLSSSFHPAIESPVVFMVAWGSSTASHNRHSNGWVQCDTHSNTHKIATYTDLLRPQAFSEPQHKDHHLDFAFPSTGSCKHWLYAVCFCFIRAFMFETKEEFTHENSEVNKSKMLKPFTICWRSFSVSLTKSFSKTYNRYICPHCKR